jgi:dinuclear metal center YbgI/SA1388 family protein
MKLKEIIEHLEKLAPLGSQENYDNAGLIVGDSSMELSNTLISLDCTEDVVQEAIDKKCNLIISHHPIVFNGIKKLTGSNYVERTVIKAIQNKIAIYVIHTNLDNYRKGVNKKIGDLLGISNPQILAPAQKNLVKISVLVPIEDLEKVRAALFTEGAGEIGNYSECSFQSEGEGSFIGNNDSTPYTGAKNEKTIVSEIKLEVTVAQHSSAAVIKAMLTAHPYEEVAYDVIPLLNANHYEGAGMIGDLEAECNENEFLERLKEIFKSACIRHTNLLNKPVKRVAWCGGAGSFLLKQAKSQNADIFITGDFKYHEFFDADKQIVIADIGHYESEQFTIDLIAELIRKKIPTFAPYLTEQNTNPIKYF